MLAFDLRHIHLMTQLTQVNQFDADNFVIIEYLGGALSSCSSIAYLSNGYLYYGSRLGDSHILRIH
jgi:hypothetical protein